MKITLNQDDSSQVSQNLALLSANRLDHYINEILRIRAYARYMDDGYLIHKDKNYLNLCLEMIKEICGELHIKLNTKKTQIKRLDKGFTYLKIRFFLVESGKIVKEVLTDEQITEDDERIREPITTTEVMEILDSMQKQIDSLTEENTELRAELQALKG